MSNRSSSSSNSSKSQTSTHNNNNNSSTIISSSGYSSSATDSNTRPSQMQQQLVIQQHHHLHHQQQSMPNQILSQSIRSNINAHPYPSSLFPTSSNAISNNNLLWQHPQPIHPATVLTHRPLIQPQMQLPQTYSQYPVHIPLFGSNAENISSIPEVISIKNDVSIQKEAFISELKRIYNEAIASFGNQIPQEQLISLLGIPFTQINNNNQSFSQSSILQPLRNRATTQDANVQGSGSLDSVSSQLDPPESINQIPLTHSRKNSSSFNITDSNVKDTKDVQDEIPVDRVHNSSISAASRHSSFLSDSSRSFEVATNTSSHSKSSRDLGVEVSLKPPADISVSNASTHKQGGTTSKSSSSSSKTGSSLNHLTLEEIQRKPRQAVKRRKASSRYRGVYYNKLSNSWRARIWLGGVSENLGCFETEEEAARAFDKRAIEIRGPGASVNFPQSIQASKEEGNHQNESSISSNASTTNLLKRRRDDEEQEEQENENNDDDLDDGSSLNSTSDEAEA